MKNIYANLSLKRRVKESIGMNNLRYSNKDLKRLIVPLIIEQFLSFIIGMTDTVMVAGVGEAAVSGVSLVDTVNILLINIFAALATGGAVVAGHFLGQGKREEASKAAEQLITFILLLSVAVNVIIYLGRDAILYGMFGKIDLDVMENARIYLMIVSFSIPFIAIYNGGAALFRVMGNSKISMYTSLLMNVVNIVGNAILIYGLKMGVAGSAIPTLLSRALAAILIMILLFNSKREIHIRSIFRNKPDFRMIKRILNIGVPNGLENSMFQLGKILVLSLVAGFGTASIAANAVANNIASFQILPGSAICLAIITVIAQCTGAGNYDQARYYTKKLMKIAYICMWVINVIILIMIPLILKIYNLSPETAKKTVEISIYHGICASIIWPMSFTLPNTLRAAGDVRYSMFISILSMWLCRIVLSNVFGKGLKMGLFGVWIAMTVDWSFRSVCFIYRYMKGKWQYKNV